MLTISLIYFKIVLSPFLHTERIQVPAQHQGKVNSKFEQKDGDKRH